MRENSSLDTNGKPCTSTTLHVKSRTSKGVLLKISLWVSETLPIIVIGLWATQPSEDAFPNHPRISPPQGAPISFDPRAIARTFRERAPCQVTGAPPH